MPLEYLLSTLTSARIQDFGDICVVEDDGTFVKINANGHPWVDYVEPYRLFRTLHGDDYDFVTFFADPQAGFPIGSTSFSVGVYNDIRGIGLGNYDNGTAWGFISQRLQQFHFIHYGHFSNWRYVMLQEFGHRWACHANYKDPGTGTAMTDHRLIGSLSHWSHELDDDKSAMDYSNYDWIDLPNGQFQKLFLSSDERSYCGLDLYLMGLCRTNDVGEFKMLRNPQLVSGTRS